MSTSWKAILKSDLIVCLVCPHYGVHYRQSLYLQGLIFIVADAFLETDVSATYFSLNLQILFSLPVMYNCIYILPFLGFKDTPFANFASTSHIFDNVKMLPSKITHLQLAFSMLCGCSPSKFCIFNPLESTIADIVARYPLSSIYFTT